jgi:Domain of unknown function (DUF4210)
MVHGINSVYGFLKFKSSPPTDQTNRIVLFSALFDSQSALASPACTDEDSCTASPDIETPHSPFATRHHPKPAWSPTSGALLGTFEESVLNGRLEPVSTVHGFTAELGASGSFCPKHLCLPVTVFFYTLGDNDKVSTPYLVRNSLDFKSDLD